MAALSLAFELTRLGLRCHGATVPALLGEMRATFHDRSETTLEDVLYRVRQADVLVLDDLGAEKDTDWAKETLFQIVNDRYARRSLTIITTNLNPTDAPTGRFWSRVLGDLTVVVETTGPDRRKS